MKSRVSISVVLCSLLVSCGSGLDVDPALAESIAEIGVATTGQLDISQDDWVRIAKKACENGAYLDPAQAERLAQLEGVVFVGTNRPVGETIQVIGEAVCAVNEV